MNNYNLDCTHYLTLPSFTFDVMLKYTNIELELICNYDKYLFFENLRVIIIGGDKRCHIIMYKTIDQQYLLM